ncbi:MAG: Cobalt-zinc-cadmium resistance protein CzcB [Syntrophus sp. SKADARSKE-3]|nr:Cobalt-zinc-cadmium resistance protein CzcB [Syntrophus sp. SKADARSKE-3]
MKNKAWIIAFAIIGMIIGSLSTQYFTIISKADSGKHDKGNHEAEEKDEHTKDRIVKLHDEDRREFGIEVQKAEPGRLNLSIELPGEVKPNENRLARIVPRAAGVVRSVLKSVGDKVQPGELLAVLDSRELADAKAAYITALKRTENAKINMKREEELWKKKISPEFDYLSAKKAYDEANIELQSAEKKLLYFGFSGEYIRRLPSQTDLSYTHYEIRAPFGGTIIERHITQGEYLKDDKEAFIIADLSSVWVNISVYQKNMTSLLKGQQVTVITGGNIPDAKGVISYISPITGEETRTSTARVILSNRQGLWRPGLFVTARVKIDEVPISILLPKTAIVNENAISQVFIETQDGFVLKPVSVGRSDAASMEVTAGLEKGQKVVTKGAFTLKAQLSKGAFGDGHVH